MRRHWLLLLLIAFSAIGAYGNLAKITQVKFASDGSLGKLMIKFNGPLKKIPQFSIKRDNILQVTIFNAMIWPQVDQAITVGRELDSRLRAYQFDPQTVRVRVILPFGLGPQAEEVSLALRDNFVELSFPCDGGDGQGKGVGSLVLGTGEAKPVGAGAGDEKYLAYLLEQKLEQDSAMGDAVSSQLLQDQITTVHSSAKVQGEGKGESVGPKSFDFMAYIGKYLLFLALVLALAYGIILLFKRGMLKKSGLGFLGDADLVSILSTTHLGPKRSLVLVKVHEQILVLGNSESGLNLLTELPDVAGLLKEGEQKLTGNNFDTTIHVAEKTGGAQKVKLKENPLQDSSYEVKKNISHDSEKISLSDQIRQKVKHLRSLQ